MVCMCMYVCMSQGNTCVVSCVYTCMHIPVKTKSWCWVYSASQSHWTHNSLVLSVCLASLPRDTLSPHNLRIKIVGRHHTHPVFMWMLRSEPWATHLAIDLSTEPSSYPKEIFIEILRGKMEEKEIIKFRRYFELVCFVWLQWERKCLALQRLEVLE